MTTWSSAKNKAATIFTDVARDGIFRPFVAEDGTTYLMGSSADATLVITDVTIFTNINKS